MNVPTTEMFVHNVKLYFFSNLMFEQNPVVSVLKKTLIRRITWWCQFQYPTLWRRPHRGVDAYSNGGRLSYTGNDGGRLS